MATPIDIHAVLPRIQYSSLAAQTIFSIPFEFFANADIVCTVEGVVQTLDIDYTLTGAGVEGGGTLTFLAGQTLDDLVMIYANIAIARDTKYTQSGDLNHEVLERDFAKMTRIQQQQELNFIRAIHLNLNDSVVSMELPLAAARASKFLAFDASGGLETAVSISPTTLTRSLWGSTGMPQSAAELANGVTPVFLYFAWGDVRRYGVIGDDVTDDTAELNAAADSGHEVTCPPELECLISGDVDFRGVPLNFKGKIDPAASGAKVLLGGSNSTDRPQPTQYIHQVVGSSGIFGAPEGTPDIEIRGTKDQTIRIDGVGTCRLYARNTVTPDDDASIAYSRFHIQHFGNLILANEGVGASAAALGGWINENDFYLGQGKICRLTGDYKHNNNRFWGGTFEEAASEIDIQIGRDNVFYDTRLEGATANTISFGPETFRNMIEVNWTSSDASYPPIVFEYSDQGVGNQVKSNDEGGYKWTPIANIDFDTLQMDHDTVPTWYNIAGVGLNDGTNPFTQIYAGTLTRSGGQLSALSFAYMFLSGLIPVSPRGASIVAATMIGASGPMNALRGFVSGYGIDGVELTDNVATITGVAFGDDTTITTAAPHGYSVGERIYIENVTGVLDGSGDSLLNSADVPNGWFPVLSVTATEIVVTANTNLATAYSGGGTVKYADYQRRGSAPIQSFEPESGPASNPGTENYTYMATILRHDCHYVRFAVRNGTGARLFDRLTVAVRNPVTQGAPIQADDADEGARRAINLLPMASPPGPDPYRTHTAPPIIAPSYIGQMFVDKTGRKVYVCTQLSTPPVAGDWSILN